MFAARKYEAQCEESNAAFVFIKPHANTTAAQNLVTSTLKAKGITIKSEGELTAEQIDAGSMWLLIALILYIINLYNGANIISCMMILT